MTGVIKTMARRMGFEVKRVVRDDLRRYPVEMTSDERDLVQMAERYSMTPVVRMWALVQAVRHVVSQGLDGDLVECGVWRGGNLVLMRKLLDLHQLQKKVWGYDTFEGMTEATDVDLDYAGHHVASAMRQAVKDEKVRNIHAYATEGTVRKNLAACGVDSGFELVRGPVEQTLQVEHQLPESISILRLDTDWYESTKAELEVLYPRLVPGGVLIVDDYGHFQGARKAVDEYFGGETPWLHYIDYTCRLMIKR